MRTRSASCKEVVKRDNASRLSGIAEPRKGSPFNVVSVKGMSIIACRASMMLYGMAGNIEAKANGAAMKAEILRFNGAVERDAAIDAWMNEHRGELGAIAQKWFEVMRQCGDEVRELLHDGCPVACLGDAPFGYVNVFTAHVNVGFFHGAALPDPARLLQGTGRFMRHVKLKPGMEANTSALNRLIEAAYSDIKARVEHG